MALKVWYNLVPPPLYSNLQMPQLYGLIWALYTVQKNLWIRKRLTAYKSILFIFLVADFDAAATDEALDNCSLSTRHENQSWRIHTTKTLPIDFLYKIMAHLTPLSRLQSNWLCQVWYHFENWDHNSSTNMKKTYDEGYFFEIQSLEEMHALNAYLPISKYF